MRGLVILFVLGVVGCIIALVFIGKTMGDQGAPIAFAFGNPDDDTLQMDVVVAMGMVNQERPRVDMRTGAVYWDEWVDDHFDLIDANGEEVKFIFRQGSDLIPDNRAGGTPEGYLRGRVKKGMAYTFDYIQKKAGPKKHRHQFTSPTDKQDVTRVTFKLVD